MVRRAADYFAPHIRKIIIITSLLIAISLSSAALPVLVSRGIDLMSEDVTIGSLALLIGAVLATGVITWGANWIRRRLTAQAVGDVEPSAP